MPYFQGDVDKRAQSKQLIVILHAWTLKAQSLSDVIDTVKANLEDADIYVPDYPAGFWSSTSPQLLAEELADRIDSLEKSRRVGGFPYETIILIGHSLGALLARKAYVIAKGQAQDCREPERQSQKWATLVDRIVLFAGMNRGWSYETRPASMGFLRYCLLRLGALTWRWFRFAKLINGIRRGSPFIVNLRIQWLNLTRQGTEMPLVVQLLGTDDDVVTRDDNIDLQCGQTFYYLRVHNTGHGNIVHFSDAVNGPERKAVFVRALMEKTLESDYQVPLVQDRKVDAVVFVIHGIRDFGDWTAGIAEMIQRLALAGGKVARTFHPSYGYFNMLDFLIQPERKDQVRWFMDEYTQKKALFPAAEINFVGHSNGTYILGSALRDYAAVTFDRAVLAGSVLPRRYEWTPVFARKAIRQVLNFVSSKDIVVAVFPKIFEDLRKHSELGSAGANGFQEDPGAVLSNSEKQDDIQPSFKEVRFISGGHGAALVPENYESIAYFITDGLVRINPDLLDKKARWVERASKFCALIWVLLLAIAAALALLPASAIYLFLGPSTKTFVFAVASIPVGLALLRYVLRRA